MHGLLANVHVTPAGAVLNAVRVLEQTQSPSHNALRGSGPGQQDAFDDAVAQVGCPDRRIDRLCSKRCSPFQPSHHTGLPA